MIILSKNVSDTHKLASIIASLVKKGDLITLNADLGGGKTTFTQGLALALGVKETVNSPTFNIVKCYFDAKIPLCHIDAYRLEGIYNDIGLDEYLMGDFLVVTEWGEFINYLLPYNRLEINIKRISDNEREITINGIGEYYQNIVKEVEKLWAIN
ncbi:MAG: tRNA (adenosine(37)-N6)-threonylcarbamoyltransferase complex ATPase subunit type 1 TsaE [Bacilli bacterium]|nr:tRNA (adenosine(37)-N6)-threonylcarbamoyltransferase complex ATPase subunit type 1 TsaE [Bacilli bacterium]